MDVFTPAELSYLDEAQGLARLATVGRDGTPHVAPVGWSLSPDRQTIEIRGHHFAATKKYRDVRRAGRAAVVIDDVLPPWRPRGIEVRGGAAAIEEPEPLIRIRPERVVSWGFDGATGGRDTESLAPRGGRARLYAVVRRNRLTDGATDADFAEFERVHAAQPGYRGNLVIDAGDGVRVAVTVWGSEAHATAAREVLGPQIQRLAPTTAEPSRLLSVGEVSTTDLPLLGG